MKISIKKLRDGATLPEYKSDGAAGFDLAAAESVRVPAYGTSMVPTGLAFAIPIGYEMQIRPRSGVALNTPLIVKNAPGTIDSDYRGEVQVIVYNLSNTPFFIEKGMRIAQGVIAPVASVDIMVVDNISSTSRGDRGFGSSGYF